MNTTMIHTIKVETDMTGWSYEQIADYQRHWRSIIKELDYEAAVTTTVTEHTPAAEAEQ